MLGNSPFFPSLSVSLTDRMDLEVEVKLPEDDSEWRSSGACSTELLESPINQTINQAQILQKGGVMVMTR